MCFYIFHVLLFLLYTIVLFSLVELHVKILLCIHATCFAPLFPWEKWTTVILKQAFVIHEITDRRICASVSSSLWIDLSCYVVCAWHRRGNLFYSVHSTFQYSVHFDMGKSCNNINFSNPRLKKMQHEVWEIRNYSTNNRELYIIRYTYTSISVQNNDQN